MGFHMIRDLEQNTRLADAVTKSEMTFIPWINQSAVLKRDTAKGLAWVIDPPYDCDVEKLAVEIEERVPDDAPLAYLDIETPMREPFSARSLAVYQDAIGVAKEVRKRTRWGIYSMVHKPLSWRTPGVPWTHWLNGIYPLCDFACPSLYPRAGRWAENQDERWRMDMEHSALVLNDQDAFSRRAFVRPRWASNGGHGQFVPLDWFTNWIHTLDRDNIAVCLFMDNHEQQNMVEQFEPYMQAVGKLRSVPRKERGDG